MAETYEPIATQTLTVAAADIFFNSIPQTYTDLVLVVTGTSASTSSGGFRVNSNNSNIYFNSAYYANGTSIVGTRSTDTLGKFDIQGQLGTTGMYIAVVNFMNYSNSTTEKVVIVRSGNGSGPTPATGIYVTNWINTNAITSINVLSQTGINYAVGSTFTLYGIKAG